MIYCVEDGKLLASACLPMDTAYLWVMALRRECGRKCGANMGAGQGSNDERVIWTLFFS
jgi:hypothetical protein